MRHAGREIGLMRDWINTKRLLGASGLKVSQDVVKASARPENCEFCWQRLTGRANAVTSRLWASVIKTPFMQIAQR